MKKMYKFLFYKLYRFSKAQEETVDAEFGFVALAIFFELLHFPIIASIYEIIFGFNYTDFISKEVYIALIFIFGFSINYFVFIKSNLIYRIDQEYQKQNRSVWKDNLLFFLYIIFLGMCIVLITWYHQEYKV